MAKVILRQDETFDSLFKRFKKAMNNDGTLQELRKREYYLSPAQKRRIKSENAQKRARKYAPKFKSIDD